MSGFDEDWKAGKVLVCSADEGRVHVWGWYQPGWWPLSGWPLWTVLAQARYIKRETQRPVWIERYGAPAVLPDQPRGFTNYRTGGVY